MSQQVDTMSQQVDTYEGSTRVLDNYLRINCDLKTLHEIQFITALYLTLPNILFAIHVGFYPVTIHLLQPGGSIKLPENTCLFNSMLYIGAVIGIFGCILINISRHPRKNYLVISVFLSIIGLIIMRKANIYFWLVLGRFIIGLGMGIYSIVSCYYSYECVFGYRIKNRLPIRRFYGFDLLNFRTELSEGIIIIFVLGWFLKWQVAVNNVLAFNILVLMLISRLPETPHHLLYEGEHEEAKKSFYTLTRLKSPETKAYLKLIKDEVAETKLKEEKVEWVNPTRKLRGYAFMMNEITGIIIYHCYIAKFSENLNSVSMIIFLVLFVYYFYKVRISCRPCNEKELKILTSKSSIVLFVNCFSLAIYSFEDYIHDEAICSVYQLIKVCALLYYFKLYTIGWMYGHCILYEDNEPYYVKLRKVPVDQFVKFTLLSLISLVFIPSAKGILYSSSAFAIISIANTYIMDFVSSKKN